MMGSLVKSRSPAVILSSRGWVKSASQRYVATSTTPEEPDTSSNLQGPTPAPENAPNTHFKVTLRRSGISLGDKVKGTLEALGLHRRFQSVYHRHTLEAAGMILGVKELVEVENVPAHRVRKEEQTTERGYEVVESGNMYENTLRGASLGSAKSSQNVTLPEIPELFEDKFLDILIPPPIAIDSEYDMVIDPSNSETKEVKNPMINALKETANFVRTDNNAPALASTLSATLDAFNSLSNTTTAGSDINAYLTAAWAEDPDLTLRIIWSLRSIPDGKGAREPFYKAFGWLYEHHPRTAIANLHLLVDGVVHNPKSNGTSAHGYWKDLPNILSMATVDELAPEVRSSILAPPRQSANWESSRKKGRAPRADGTPSKLSEHLERNAQRKKEAQQKRAETFATAHTRLTQKLADPKFRALYISVTRLFGDRLIKDLAILQNIKSLPPGDDKLSLLKTISLAGKWAPTPACSHDRVTNLSSAIAFYIYTTKPTSLELPNPLDESLDARSRFTLLRQILGRSVLRPLREISECPEPRMAANKWTSISYSRVASTAMKNNTEHFFKHDPTGFEKYLTDVESGKKQISGATLFPHEIIGQIAKLSLNEEDVDFSADRKPTLADIKKKLSSTQLRVAEAQWKTLIANLKAAGKIENSVAICDVSGSMCNIYDNFTAQNPLPIHNSVALSLVLAYVAAPPFNSGFITFSESPQFITLDLETKSLSQIIEDMVGSDWGMNTDLNAVFLKLLLPLAKKNNIKQEDMIKRLFIFSDMQFDEAERQGQDAADWETNYDLIEKAYTEAGYEVPQIVFWDLNSSPGRTVEATAFRKGVAMMNGFSPALLKVFMGEGEGAASAEWEAINKEGAGKVVKIEEEFNPVNVMKKALLKESFDGLKVFD